MKKYFVSLFWILCSANMHADQPEHFQDMHSQQPDGTESYRAVQTAHLNNLLVLGNTNVHGNVIVDGTITNSQAVPDMCGTITGPNPSTLNAIARYANTSGNLLADSGVLIDDNNNVSGIKSLPTTTVTASATATIGGPLITQGLTYKTAIDVATLNDNDTFPTPPGTAILIIKHATPGDPISGNTISFPPTLTNGQLFTLINGDSADINNLTLTSAATIFNPVPNLKTGTNQTATYIYYSGTWYLISN